MERIVCAAGSDASLSLTNRLLWVSVTALDQRKLRIWDSLSVVAENPNFVVEAFGSFLNSHVASAAHNWRMRGTEVRARMSADARARPPTGALQAALSHPVLPAPIRLWPHFFHQASTSSVHHSSPHPILTIEALVHLPNHRHNGVRIIDPTPPSATAQTALPEANCPQLPLPSPNTTSYEIRR
jgi:hypothetical protein